MSATREITERDLLPEGLEALRCGRDPLIAGLAAARRLMGARRGVWMSGEGAHDGVVVVGEQRSYRAGDLPAELPLRFLPEAPKGRVRLLGPDLLRRDPRAVASGIQWALVAAAEQGTGVLWFDAPAPLEANPISAQATITALGHLEDLARERECARRRDRLVRLGELSAGVAHDLRNQLSLVHLEYRRLQAEFASPSEGLGGAIEDAVQLCRDFLSGACELPSQSTWLRPLLTSEIRAAADLSGRSGEVGIALRCPRELRAGVEPRFLHRILQNLLLNAIAATPNGSQVRVQAKSVGGGGVELSVADEGHGMSRAELERLLRAGESRGGTGFGTSSVLACVEEMAGELVVESEPGKGTRFTLRLGVESLPATPELESV